MTFDRFGRTRHLHLADADDLGGALELDEGLWVATSAPVSTLRGDKVFLALVDSDANGRIRVSEMKQAIRWLLDHLADRTGLSAQSELLKLDRINRNNQTGKQIYDSARHILAAANQADSDEIGLTLIRQTKARLADMPVSEAGVVLPQAAQDEQTQQFIRDIIAVTGGAQHPSGHRGVSKTQLANFLSQARAYLDWHAKSTPANGQLSDELFPLGQKTASAFGLLTQVRDRIDQYFAQCQAVAFNSALASRLPPQAAAVTQTDFNDPTAIANLLAQAPLAEPDGQSLLTFTAPINPHDQPALARLQNEVLAPLLGESVEQLTQAQWQQVQARFTAFNKWQTARPNRAITVLDNETLQRYCDTDLSDAVAALIEGSSQTALQLKHIRQVEKLVLYQAHLLDLANNFISFPDLYDPRRRAMFETGSLVMDGRHFDFAVGVADRAAHAKVVGASDMFVLYVQIERHDSPTPLVMAVPVTSGGKGNLVVAKRGIFKDVAGKEWDASVVQIIENPISIGEAIVAPFQRIGKLIGGKIEQITSTAEKQLDTTAQQAMAPAPTAVPTQTAQNRGLLAGGVLAGGGLALAAVGSAIAYIGNIVSENPAVLWGGLIGAILAVLLPTAVLAFLKLRRRDLSAILEGAGWAINARMRLTLAQGRHFTRRPVLPRGAADRTPAQIIY